MSAVKRHDCVDDIGYMCDSMNAPITPFLGILIYPLQDNPVTNQDFILGPEC